MVFFFSSENSNKTYIFCLIKNYKHYKLTIPYKKLLYNQLIHTEVMVHYAVYLDVTCNESSVEYIEVKPTLPINPPSPTCSKQWHKRNALKCLSKGPTQMNLLRVRVICFQIFGF